MEYKIYKVTVKGKCKYDLSETVIRLFKNKETTCEDVYFCDNLYLQKAILSTNKTSAIEYIKNNVDLENLLVERLNELMRLNSMVFDSYIQDASNIRDFEFEYNLEDITEKTSTQYLMDNLPMIDFVKFCKQNGMIYFKGDWYE